jgi:hypothetical protein
MRNDETNLAVLERDLRALAAPQPHDEVLRRKLRDQLVPQPQPARRRLPRMRLALPAAAALSAATVAVILALVGAAGGGPSGAGAAVLHDTLAAVTPPSDTILHVKAVAVANGVTFEGEWWQESNPPYASRGIKGPAGNLGEFGDDGTTSFSYDASTNTIYEQPDSAPPTFADPVSLVQQQLANGQAELVGTTVIDGQALYQIALAGGVTTYVDQTTYVPRYIDSTQRNGTMLRFKVVAFEYLGITPANLQLLSVTSQHPGAQIDKNPNDWPGSTGK